MGTYSYTGSAKFVTVQKGGTFDIQAFGGQGGAYTGGNGAAGGLGAEIGGNFQLTTGEHLEIVVGNAGSAGDFAGGGGGGGSFVLGNGTGNGSGNGTYTLLLAAGGGGGGYYKYNGGNGLTSSGTGNGGAGPYDGGGGGSGYKGKGGSGGTSRDYSSGGVGGSNRTGGYAGGTYSRKGDTSAVGGFGGGGSGAFKGGGGGGGYSGGNGGYRSASGGGASIDKGTAIAAQTIAGENTGAGKVVFSPSVCFATGTTIRVIRDGAPADVAVEDLAVGDIAVTASGAHRPVAWIGSRTLDCAGFDDPRRVRPIRIAKNAFGPDRPSRDLCVSPDHAICVDLLGEVLVPAFAFLNGSTVTQDRDDHVTYWHVELEGGHDILLAENLPCESYLDCGNRGFFSGADAAMDPDLAAKGSCRERTADPVLMTALRAKLRRHAQALGWRLDAADLGGMRLIADGATILPDSDGLAARFLLPVDARDVWLVSSASVPWEVGNAADGRRLGLCLGGLAVGDGLLVQRDIALDDARLVDGFHPSRTLHTAGPMVEPGSTRNSGPTAAAMCSCASSSPDPAFLPGALPPPTERDTRGVGA